MRDIGKNELGKQRSVIQQVLVEAQALDFVVDEYEVTADPEVRQSLLDQGLTVSIRGLGHLVDEPFVQDPRRYRESLERQQRSDGWTLTQGLEHLRGDAVTVKSFVSAESRLLSDIGLPLNAVARTRRAMIHVIVETQFSTEESSDTLPDLREELEQDRKRVQNQDNHHGIWRRLGGVLEALGGALVVGADDSLAVAAAPVTGGLSIYGAELSKAIGAEVFLKGVSRARRG